MSATGPSRSALVWLLVGSLGILLALYFDTYASIVAKWFSDAGFSHGVLVLPISLALIWRRRAVFADAEWRPDWLGLIALIACGGAWLLARGTGVLVVEQLAAVAMVPAVVLALVGRNATRTIMFPLLFLLFAVPFGQGAVPSLMRITADLTVTALHLSGVPVIRDGMMFSIPSGDFEVARACSGLNYLITGVALGMIYAYLTYASFWKRLAFTLAAIGLPILLNGFRAYVIIAVAHLTDMQWGAGKEHVLFGRVLFLLAMLLLFWIGQRWRDPIQNETSTNRLAATRSTESTGVKWRIVVVLSLFAIVAPYAVADSWSSNRHSNTAIIQIALPHLNASWRGPEIYEAAWRPHYSGAAQEVAGTYEHPVYGVVEVFAAVYLPSKFGGQEMISYRNRIVDTQTESLLPESLLDLSLGHQQLSVREFLVPDGRSGRIVWQWYMVDEALLTGDFQVKWKEAISLVMGRPAIGRVLVLSAASESGPEEARASLLAFAKSNEACIRAGFATAKCSR